MNVLSQISFFSQSAKIGTIQTGIVVSERTENSMTITAHPIQIGAPVTDHAFKNPVEVHLTAEWGQPGVLDYLTADIKTPNDIWNDLLVLQASANPFYYIPSQGVFLRNMLIKSLSRLTDKETYNILAINAVLYQPIFVDIAPVAMQATNQANPSKTAPPTSTGSAQPAKVPASGGNNSILDSLSKEWKALIGG